MISIVDVYYFIAAGAAAADASTKESL